MATALAVYGSDGLEGRCDAKCHEAKEPDCDCICGGKRHGVGDSHTAIAMNTADVFGSLEEAEKWAIAHGINRPKVKGPGISRGRRSLERLLQPQRAERAQAIRRNRRLGIVPGQEPLFPAVSPGA